WDFTFRMVYLLLLVVILGGYGILCSVLIRKTFAAILVSYAVSVAGVWGAAGLLALILEPLKLNPVSITEILRYASPVMFPIYGLYGFEEHTYGTLSCLCTIGVTLFFAHRYLHRASQRTAHVAP